MAEVEIKARENGPYRVQGPIRLVDAEGNEYDLGERGEVIALCRLDDEAVLRRDALQGRLRGRRAGGGSGGRG